MRTSQALAVLERVERHRPEVVTLARLASPAVRIEAGLLRSLRRTLGRDLDVGTEADLWHSPLVESRDSRAVVLEPAVSEILRHDLRRDREELEAVLGEIRRAHVDSAPSLQLEEALIAHALREVEPLDATVTRLLGPALEAMRQGGDAADRVARWAMRALPQLPVSLHSIVSLRLLAIGSSTLMGRDVPLARASEANEAAWAWALPREAFQEMVTVSVELRDSGVALSRTPSDSPTITVPKTRPLFAQVEWNELGQTHVEPRLFEESAWVPLPPGVRSADVVTLRGDVFRLNRTRGSSTETTVFAVYDRDDSWSAAMIGSLRSVFHSHGLRVIEDRGGAIREELETTIGACDAGLVILSHGVVLHARMEEGLELLRRRSERDDAPIIAVAPNDFDSTELQRSASLQWLERVSMLRVDLEPESAERIAATLGSSLRVASNASRPVRQRAHSSIEQAIFELEDHEDFVRSMAFDKLRVQIPSGSSWRSALATALMEQGLSVMGDVMERLTQIGASETAHRIAGIMIGLHLNGALAARLLEKRPVGIELDAVPAIARGYVWRAALEHPAVVVVQADHRSRYSSDASLADRIDDEVRRVPRLTSQLVLVLIGDTPSPRWRSREEILEIAERGDVRLVAVSNSAQLPLDRLERDEDAYDLERRIAESLSSALDSY